jgi:hypothetical protein
MLYINVSHETPHDLWLFRAGFYVFKGWLDKLQQE